MHVAFAQSSAIDYELLVSSMPGLYFILAPDLTIVNVSEAYLHNTLLTRDDLVGRKFFDALPENPELAESAPLNTLKKSLLHVLNFHTTHSIPVLRYDIPKPKNLGGGFDERYWMISNHPVVGKDDKLQYIVHQVIDVTMQQLAHRQINTNRERYELLAQASSDVVWDWDLLNNHLWWSESFQGIFGYNQDDFSNIEAWIQKVHPEERENVFKSVYDTVNIGGKTWTDSYRVLRADGSYAYVLERGYILHDENGVAYRMVGAMYDITEHIEKSQKSRPSHDNYQKILDAMPNLAWCLKPGTNDRNGASYSNRAWKEYTGLTTDLLHGAEKVMHADDLATAPAKLAHCLETQHRFEQEIRLKNRKTGDYRWFDSQAVPILDEKGNVSLWFGTCTDINDKKELKKAKQASVAQPKKAVAANSSTATTTEVPASETKPAEIQTAELLAQLPLPAWVVSADSTTLQGNTYFAEIIGASEITSRNWLNLIHPEDITKYERNLEQAKDSGVFAEITYRLQDSQSNYVWISEKAKPTFNAGEISFWVHTGNLVAAPTVAEITEESPAALTQPVNSEITFHVQNLAQDLKKPLTNLEIIFEELTRTAVFSDEDSSQLSAFFRKSIAKTQQLINGIETAIKTDAEAKETAYTFVSLEQVYVNVKAKLQAKYRMEKLEFTSNFKAAPTVWLTAEKLENLLFTLLAPALQAAPAHKLPKVILTSSISGGCTVITAKTDPASPVNLQATLFKDSQFYLLQREIQQAGGRIELSNPEEINEVLFQIYLKKPLTQIILVEEDETTNFLHKRLLGRLASGVKITASFSGLEVLTYLQENANTIPDLIFLDLQTTLQSGNLLLEHFARIQEKGLPVPEITLLAPASQNTGHALMEQYTFIKRMIASPLTEENTALLLQDFLAV